MVYNYAIRKLKHLFGGHMNQSTLNISVQQTRELDAEALRLVKLEENCSANLVVHLVEMHAKRVYLELGYSNLVEYCVNRLQLSIGQSRFRCQLAKLCTRFPLALESLAKGTLSITVLGKLSAYLNPSNCSQLLRDCKGMSRLQVQDYVAKLRDKMVAKAPVKEEASLFSAKAVNVPREKSSQGDFLGSIKKTVVDFKPAASQAVMRFLASSPELLEKLERLAEVDNKRSLKESLIDLLDKAVSDSLDKRDPKKKLERREARQKAKSSKETKEQAQPKAVSKKNSRYIPSELRGLVYAEASYQCEFVGSRGQRCSQRTGLQVDHIQPFALSGSSERENLRCLCAPHNLHEAKKKLGEEFMESKIRRQTTSKSEATMKLIRAYIAWPSAKFKQPYLEHG